MYEEHSSTEECSWANLFRSRVWEIWGGIPLSPDRTWNYKHHELDMTNLGPTPNPHKSWENKESLYLTNVESSCGQDIAYPECRNKDMHPYLIQRTFNRYVGRHKYIGVNTNSKNMCKNIYVNLRTSSLFRFLPDPRKDAPPEMTSDTG